MIGITLGSGKAWKANAAAAANQMQKMTKIKCHVFDYEEEGVHPYWYKYLIPRYFKDKNFLYFDSDIYCIKPWDPRQLVGAHPGKFMGCLDRVDDPYLINICKEQYLDVNRYINAGFFIFNQSHFHIFDLIWNRRYMEERFALAEQGALNEYLQLNWDQVHVLDNRYNRMIWINHIPEGELFNNSTKSDNTINVHSSYEPGFENDKELRFHTKLKQLLPCTI